MEHRQATYEEIVDALDGAMGYRHGDTRPAVQILGSPAPGNIGTITRHYYGRTGDAEYAEIGFELCVLGHSKDAPAFIMRDIRCCEEKQQARRAVQISLDAVGATAELLPHTLTPEQVQALLRAALHAQCACREMHRLAERSLEVTYGYQEGETVRF